MHIKNILKIRCFTHSLLIIRNIDQKQYKKQNFICAFVLYLVEFIRTAIEIPKKATDVLHC